MRVKITDRCKVWEINDLDGKAEVQFSTSRKVRENDAYDQIQVDNGVAKNGYISESHSYVRFVGHAYNKLKEISSGDVITNLEADIRREPYWDSQERCIKYPKNYKMTVFSFEIYNPENYNTQVSKTNLDKAPQVAEEKATLNTIAQPKTETEIKTNEIDECPF